MSGYDEIGAMEFSEGFLLVQGKPDVLRKMLIEEYDLDEATANWHIEQAQQWAVQTKKKLKYKLQCHLLQVLCLPINIMLNTQNV